MNVPPLQVSHLFSQLDDLLLQLLHSLTPEEWEAQTVARLWKVKDVAAHLLDGNIRVLSIQRDRFFGEQPPPIETNEDLVNWLNKLNADWVQAARRISPQVMILLHEATRRQVSAYYAGLDPFGKAIFAVSWAGENESLNWMHVAREYTEKWLHQQQIRDAVNRPGILTKALFTPFIQTFMYALPHTYRNTEAPEGTVVRLTVTTDIGDSWDLCRREGTWQLQAGSPATQPHATLVIDPDTAWKLFSKSLRPSQVAEQVMLLGDRDLAAVALQMVSVMA